MPRISRRFCASALEMTTSAHLKIFRLLLLSGLLSAQLACSKSQTKSGGEVQTSAPRRHELLTVGSEAPLFQTTAHNGTSIELEKLRGKVVVLYFYPKDGTPGCTAEAQGFAAEYESLENQGAVVLGVSTDDSDSHRKFAEEHGLPFYLIPDTDRALAEAYGVGSTFGMTSRVTYIIDRAGKIARVYPNVQPKEHAKEILRALAEL